MNTADAARAVLAMLPDTARWVEARGMLLSGRGRVVGIEDGDPPAIVLLQPDVRLAAVLSGWDVEPAHLHELPEGTVPARPAGSVRLLEPGEHARLPELPQSLAAELAVAAAAGSGIAAAWQGEQAVAFCYAGSITERLWDVSIDTLVGFRRRGNASRCAAFMIHELARAGKRAVWGAAESNLASWRLATKLGFRRVDTVDLFSRPDCEGSSAEVT